MSDKPRPPSVREHTGLSARSLTSRRRGAAPALRLYETSFPIAGTLCEIYLQSRGLRNLADLASLRFHPHYYYKAGAEADAREFPLLLAPVTNSTGELVGVLRIWLSPHGKSTLPVETAQQGFGDVIGNAVRFGGLTDPFIVTLSVEVALSFRAVFPDIATVALGAPDLVQNFVWPDVKRVFIARDARPTNKAAYESLATRAKQAGIAVQFLTSRGPDFNEDLRSFGPDAMKESLRKQMLS